MAGPAIKRGRVLERIFFSFDDWRYEYTLMGFI